MGGKSKSQTVGYHYRPAYHVGLCRGPIDAFLEFRAADKTAWSGVLSASGRIEINQPGLFGGEKDQGGIEGPVDLMFGEPDQLPNEYLRSVFGDQIVAWRGLATLVFAGGRFGAMNPMPQKPAYKIRKILKGWESDDCWYPEKAEVRAADEVIVPALSSGWQYVQIPYHDAPGYEHLTPPADGWAPGTAPFGDSWTWPGQPSPQTTWSAGTILWARRTVVVPQGQTAVARVRAENGCILFLDGAYIGAVNRDNPQIPLGDAIDFTMPPGTHELVIKAFDEHPTLGDTYLSAEILGVSVRAMNPAHALYYVRTDGEKGREPRAGINDASLRAAADQLHTEGFGLCWEYDPTSDTPDGFTERICRIIGGSFERDLIDGEWYLDLARGDYDIESLPIIGDDDILAFKELPTTLDRAVNSISVRYFDPELKETIVTPSVRALGLIRQFGEIHETLDFPEIPTGSLALRVAERELRARVTPTRTFELSTTPRSKGLRRNQYFRLQSPRRRIADMVCIVGEKQTGALTSGAIQWKVSQDVYSLPDASYAEVEHGVDTRPPSDARMITSGRVLEAPYIEVMSTLPRAELEALPDDVGYLVGLAEDPGQHLDFTLAVRPDGGEFEQVATGDWCPGATINEAANRLDTEFTLSDGARLNQVQVGMAVIWDDEICRVDGLDLGVAPPTLTLGRGCADTVPQNHAAGSRVLFMDGSGAVDPTEYTEGETVHAALLSNTGSHQFPSDAASSVPVTFAGRQARPYAPGQFMINGESYPEQVSGDIAVSWAHRDRLLQADQIVDQSAPSIGPEAGVEYLVEYFAGSDVVPLETQGGITGGESIWSPPGNGIYRVELRAVRDGLESWAKHVHTVQRGTEVELWTPEQIPTQLWLDAADPTTRTVVSGAISEWLDKSGSANHCAQGTSGKQPALVSGGLNGLDVFEWAGSGQQLMMGENTMGRGLSQLLFSCLLRPDQVIQENRFFNASHGTGDINARLLLGLRSNSWRIGGRRTDAGPYVEDVSVSAAGDAGNWVLIIALFDYANATLNLWRNGTQVSTGAWLDGGVSSDTNSQSATLGGNTIQSNQFPFDGQIAELVAAQNDASSDTRQRIEGYMLHRWGLQSLLPAGHPYKVNPPAGF